MAHAHKPAKKFKYGDKVLDIWDGRIVTVVGIWGGYSCCSDIGERKRNWYYLVKVAKNDLKPGDWPVECIDEDFFGESEKEKNMTHIVVSARCSDMANVRIVEIVDEQSVILEEHEGYMPFIQGLGGGDYIHFIIDNETGRVFGWEPVYKLVAEV